MSTHSALQYYKKWFFILGFAVLIISLIIILLNPLLTLLSLKQIDEDLYMMTYYGNGLFPVTRKGLLAAYDKRVPGYFSMADRMTLNSTAFTVMGENSAQLVGHNHNDANAGPVLLLVSKPRSGYSSISFINLTYLGYSGEAIPGFFKRFALFLAPTFALSGMNEKGLVIATAAVRPESLSQIEDKHSITGFSAVQLLLRKAKTVDEAIKMLEKNPPKFAPWPQLHYLLADASGQSSIIEYLDGEMVVTTAKNPYQVMSNEYVTGSTPETGDERSVFLTKQLGFQPDRMDSNDVMDLLEGVAKSGRTQWSTVFNSQTREIQLVIEEDFTEIHHIQVIKNKM